MDHTTAFIRHTPRVWGRAGTLTLATTIALTPLSLLTPATAHATTTASVHSAEPRPQARATHGYGHDIGDGFIGQEIINGVATYCLEILASPPTGSSVFLGHQGWGSMSADDNARVNWAVSNHGQYADHNWAAATHLFVWSLADAGVYNSHGMSGDTYYVARAPRSERADILAKLAQIRADAPGITAGQTSGGGGLALDVQGDNHYVGTVAVSGLNPGSASGTLSLTNGVFTDTGSSSISGVVNGMVLPVRGNPQDGVVDYKIAAAGSFSKDTGYASRIGLYQSAGGAQQHTAGPGPRSSVSFTLAAEDPMSRSTKFQPVATSQMQQTLVGPGGTVTDQAVCEIATDSLTPEWRRNRDGSGVTVLWDVAFYEKGDDENDLPEVPEGREPIGSGEASCAAVGDMMEASIELPAGITGAITAVWSMDLDRQDETTAKTLQDNWHDLFGLAAETSMAPRVTTKAVPAVYDGEEYGDTALHTDVDLYPATAVQTFTAYQIRNGQHVCDASTVYRAESEPILIDGRTEVPGPTFIASPDMGEGVDWIERTYADDTKETLLSEGACGDPDEQTLRKVKPVPPLVVTGFGGGTIGWVAGGLVALGLALLGGLLVRRRTTVTSPIADEAVE